MSLTLDHLVILVKDLAQAVMDYERLGFMVTPGGEHTDGATHNVLIAFQDGSYLELIAFKRPAPKHRWWRYTQINSGEGLIDYALLPDDIGAEIAAIRGRGLTYTGPFDGGRVRPDGQAIRWQTGLPPTPELPFLCADVTPRNLRVPGGTARQHPNGVTGVFAIHIPFDNDLLQQYSTLLGIAGASRSFQLGSTSIELQSGPRELLLAAPAKVAIDQTLIHSVLLQIGH